jgi:16S rRNA (adenine(1408)-N(1))-methyltransferase
MVEAATRAARKPSKGGAPNARFIVAAAEALPPTLARTADLVTVQFPWGSLLRGIVRGEPAIVGPLAGLLKPIAEAELRLLISVEGRDGASGLAALDAHGADRIVRSFREAGSIPIDVRPATTDDLAAARSSWAKRLAIGRGATSDRTAWYLRFAAGQAAAMLGPDGTGMTAPDDREVRRA